MGIMDKRGVKILISCLLCTLIMLVLFIITFRFLQPSCELVYIEPIQMRSKLMANFAKDKPKRSRDKTMLIKLSAYLEYNLASSSSPSWTPTNDFGSVPAQAVTSNNANQQTLASSLGNQVVGNAPSTVQQSTSSGQGGSQSASQTTTSQSGQQQPISSQPSQSGSASNRYPVPSVPSSSLFGGLSQPQQGSSGANSSSGGSPWSTFSSQSNNPNTEKRFLPLELESIESKEISESRQKYTLTFNCTTITMYLVRQPASILNRPERVYIEQISLDLKVEAKRKSSCEIQQANIQTTAAPSVSGGLFATDVAHNGLAHYYCDRPIRLTCNHHSEGRLAELYILGLEFESGKGSGSGSDRGDSSHTVGKSFSSRREPACDALAMPYN